MLTPPVQLPPRANDAHKGNFGRALLIGGSRGMAGSIAMSGLAALRTGSGWVTAAIPDRCLETVAGIHPAIMTLPCYDDGSGRFAVDCVSELEDAIEKADAVGCGPGMTTDPGAVAILRMLLECKNTMRVFDADALNVLSGFQDWQTAYDLERVVLTPHPGEMQRLTGAPASDREAQIQAASIVAQETGAVVVLKGGPTEVFGAKGRIFDKRCSVMQYTNTTGNPGMSSAGVGDVLTGVVTSLLGQGLRPWDAARLGVWMHGRAGDLAKEVRGEAAMTAMEIIDALG